MLYYADCTKCGRPFGMFCKPPKEFVCSECRGIDIEPPKVRVRAPEWKPKAKIRTAADWGI